MKYLPIIACTESFVENLCYERRGEIDGTCVRW